jgi:hypothetical protein
MGVGFLALRIILMAGSGQTNSHIPQTIQPSILGFTAGVPINPKFSDQDITWVGHFSMHSPQPLHKSKKIVKVPFSFS